MHSQPRCALHLFAAATLACGVAVPGYSGNGDIDGNGSVTRPDVVLALRFAGGLQTPNSGQASAADTIAGGGVNILDAVRIGRIAAGKDPFIPGTGGSAPLPTSATVVVANSGTTTKDFTLPAGFTVSGTVNIASMTTFGYVALRETTTKAIYGPTFVSFMSKTFSLTVPAGTYQIIFAAPEDDVTDNGDSVQRISPVNVLAPFAVNANVANKNFDPPTPPAATGVKVAYAGQGTTNLAPDSISFTDSSLSPFATFGTGNSASVELLNLDPDIIPLGAGTYRAMLMGRQMTSLGTFVDFTWYNAPTVTAPTSSTFTITIPAVRELTGTITEPSGGGGQPTDVGIYAVNTSGSYSDSSAQITFPYGYTLMAPAGDYLLDVTVDITNGTDYIDFYVPAKINATGPSTKNVSLPALPTFRTLTGVVKGPDGKVLPNALVYAYLPDNLTVPSGGRYAYTGNATTDANGRYTMQVPPDTYTVSVYPP